MHLLVLAVLTAAGIGGESDGAGGGNINAVGERLDHDLDNMHVSTRSMGAGKIVEGRIDRMESRGETRRV